MIAAGEALAISAVVKPRGRPRRSSFRGEEARAARAMSPKRRYEQ
jgi:hypothetical protein